MKINVVVIDDHVDFLKALKSLMTASGYTVETTDEGKTGIRLVCETTPDIVILDWNLPDISGLEVCKFLRSHKPTSKIPIIMLTAFNEINQKVSAFQNGADDYITKPFNNQELLARIEAVLR